MMRNMSEINTDLDSIRREVLKQRMAYFLYKPAMFSYFAKKDSVVMPREVYEYKLWHDSATRAKYISEEKTGEVVKDSLKRVNQTSSVKKKTFPTTSKKLKKPALSKVSDSTLTKSVVKLSGNKTDSLNLIVNDSVKKDLLSMLDSVFKVTPDKSVIQQVTNNVRMVQNQMAGSNTELDRYKKEEIIFDIQWHKILASSAACIAMFLIGAPLGAIIKKGGLGVPFLVSVLFFIVYYVLTIQGEKFAKQEKLSVVAGVWMPDLILLMIGLFFLRQARIDARFFETDFYHVIWDKLKSRLKRKKALQANAV
jgi:lipopolysaccharide export system permease protein